MNVGAREQTVRTVGGASKVDVLRDIAVIGANGGAVRLGELGRIEDSWSEPRQRARLDGREVVAFSVYPSAGFERSRRRQGRSQGRRHDERRRIGA